MLMATPPLALDISYLAWKNAVVIPPGRSNGVREELRFFNRA